MGRMDRISGIFLLILSILICVGANQLGIGSVNRPGSGFFPFVLGLIIGLLSVLMGLETILAKGMKAGGGVLLVESGDQKKVLLILLTIFFYGMVLEWCGYVLTTFLVILFISRVIESGKWLVSLGAAFLAAIGGFILFDLCLNVSLPRGFLGL